MVSAFPRIPFPSAVASPAGHPVAVALVASVLVVGVLVVAARAGPAASPAAAAEAAPPPARLAYSVSVLGLPIARADFDLDDRSGRYAADVAWRTTGIAGVFHAASGTVSAKGRLASDALRPREFHLTGSGDHPVDVAMTLADGTVDKLSAEPPTKVKPDTVPLTDAHKRGVVDPLSALLVGGSVAPEKVCDRTLPVFDGWTRWDVRLSPKKTDDKAPKGLAGPTVVCAARWVPVAGHRPSNKSVRYMIANETIEISLARLPDRSLWLPVEASSSTMIGTARATLVSAAIGAAADGKAASGDKKP